MNLYLIIAILLANLVAIGAVYQCIKKLPKKEILIFIAVSVAFMYILISIVYWISGFGMEKQIHEGAKSFVTYLFVPVNVILFIPYFASQYRKCKQKQIKREELAKKCTTLVMLLLVVLVIEYFYFGNIQKNIKSISEQKEINNQTEQNETLDSNTIREEETTQNVLNVNEETFQNTLRNEI